MGNPHWGYFYETFVWQPISTFLPPVIGQAWSALPKSAGLLKAFSAHEKCLGTTQCEYGMAVPYPHPDGV